MTQDSQLRLGHSGLGWGRCSEPLPEPVPERGAAAVRWGWGHSGQIPLGLGQAKQDTAT